MGSGGQQREESGEEERREFRCVGIGVDLSCVLGSVVYRILIAFALNTDFIGLTASDVNVVTAILVVIALVAPGRKFRSVRVRAGASK